MTERQPTQTPLRNTKGQSTLMRMGILGGVLVAFALRLLNLGSSSLWYDESVSAFLAQQKLSVLLRHTAGDIHPPGYYLLLHFWQSLVVLPAPAPGLEFLLAWPSLVFGMLLVVLTCVIGRRLFGRTVALLALGLAAVQPFQIWYSQEVRMYTLGAFLGMMALWATLHYWAPQYPDRSTWVSRGWRTWRWLLLYSGCGAAGLYTLYYFLFVLVALSLIAVVALSRSTSAQPHMKRQRIGSWLLAQVAILLLWLPWLPIFWRQVTDPPVPPWRMPWTAAGDVIAALSETASALLSGQSAPFANHWLWLVVALALLLGSQTRKQSAPRARHGLQIVALYTLLPVAILFGVTLMVTPIYHVRYVMLYAPLFVLWVAVAIEQLYRRNRGLGTALCALLLLVNGWSLFTLWHAPQLRRDDHRSAVAQLAAEWRPGDLILVNAGWIYTSIEIYWPTLPIGPNAALPPPLQAVSRLPDYAGQLAQGERPNTEPILVRTGSVDGAQSLGWGDTESDFFAMDRATTINALETISRYHRRLWHYRLYDTVNDPDGVIRRWLDEHATLVRDEAVPGRDYLRLQLYELADDQRPLAASTPALAQGDANATTENNRNVPLGQRGHLQLLAAQPQTTTLAAGTTLYVQTQWQRLPAKPATADAVSFSLRLYDDRGIQVAQQDVTPWSAAAEAEPQATVILALPLPVATQPGSYQLRLLLYDSQNGMPLANTADNGADPSLSLATIHVEPAAQTPLLPKGAITFDYIDLLTLSVGQATVTRGHALAIEAIWRPQANRYRDTYLLEWRLIDPQGAVVQRWEEPLGSWAYPSGTWVPTLPVRQLSQLTVEPTTASGNYRLLLRMLRNSDKQPVAPRRSWWPLGAAASALPIDDGAVIVATVTVAEP